MSRWSAIPASTWRTGTCPSEKSRSAETTSPWTGTRVASFASAGSIPSAPMPSPATTIGSTCPMSVGRRRSSVAMCGCWTRPGTTRRRDGPTRMASSPTAGRSASGGAISTAGWEGVRTALAILSPPPRRRISFAGPGAGSGCSGRSSERGGPSARSGGTGSSFSAEVAEGLGRLAHGGSHGGIDDTAAPDVDAAGQLGARAHGAQRSQHGELQRIGQGGVGQPEGRRARHEGGHVGDAIVQDAVDGVDRVHHRGGPDRLDAAALVHRHVHHHRPRLHALDHGLGHEHGGAGARDEHGADQEIGPLEHLLDVVAIGGDGDDAPAEDVVGMAQAVEVDVEEGDVGAIAQGHLGGVETDGARAEDGDVAVGDAGHAREQDAAPPVGFAEVMRALLDGQAPGHFAHRSQEGQAAVRARHRLVGDGDALAGLEAAAQLGHAGQVEVGEEDLALARARHFLADSLLDLEDELGLAPHAVGHRHHGARASIVVVAESAASARIRLDEDAVPRFGEGARARRRQGDALLADLDLFRNADHHGYDLCCGLLRLLEVDALVDGQSLQIAPQAVQAHLDGAQADPLAAAQDARAPRGGLRLGGDGQADGAAELDAVRALVQVDEHGQRMRGAALLPGRPRDLLRRLLRDLVLQRSARQADGRAQLDQIAGHEATAEDALRSRQVGDARGDLPAREGLHDGERGLATRELGQNDAFERLVVLGQDEVAEPLADLLLDGGELPLDLVHVGPTHGQLGLELRVVGAEAQLHAAVGHQLLHAGEQRVHVRFAEAVGVEALQVDGGLETALREEPRDDLLLEHAPELAGDAGSEEEAGLADVHGEAAGGADGIVDDLRRYRQHGLLPVVGRHDAATPAEEVLHAGEPFFVQDELDARRLSRDFLGQVVDGGAEPAVDDDGIRALGGKLKGPEQALAVVAHRGLPLHGEAHVLQLLAHVAEVGVDDLAGEDLVARADDLEPHVVAWLSLWIRWGRCQVRKWGMTSREKSSMERRILSWARPPKFIQHSTWPTPMSRMVSSLRITVSGDPKATVSATSPSHVTLANRSTAARKPGCRLGCCSSMLSGIWKRRSESWYHISASLDSASACASVGAT